jgi:hypothetical protein
MSAPSWWVVWLVALAAVFPWAAFAVWYLRLDRGTKEVPPSMGELARRRLWQQ